MPKISLDIPLSMKERIDSIKGPHSFSYTVRVLLQKALNLPDYLSGISRKETDLHLKRLNLDIEALKIEVSKKESELKDMLDSLEGKTEHKIPKNNPHNLTDEEFQAKVEDYKRTL